MCSVPSVDPIHVAVSGPIGTNFGARMQIHLERVVAPKKLAGGVGGGVGGQKFKSQKKHM